MPIPGTLHDPPAGAAGTGPPQPARRPRTTTANGLGTAAPPGVHVRAGHGRRHRRTTRHVNIALIGRGARRAGRLIRGPRRRKYLAGSHQSWPARASASRAAAHRCCLRAQITPENHTATVSVRSGIDPCRPWRTMLRPAAPSGVPWHRRGSLRSPRPGASAGNQAVARSCARALGGITGSFTPSGWWNSLRREVDWYQAGERRHAGPGPARSRISSAGEAEPDPGRRA